MRGGGKPSLDGMYPSNVQPLELIEEGDEQPESKAEEETVEDVAAAASKFIDEGRDRMREMEERLGVNKGQLQVDTATAVDESEDKPLTPFGRAFNSVKSGINTALDSLKRGAVGDRFFGGEDAGLSDHVTADTNTNHDNEEGTSATSTDDSNSVASRVGMRKRRGKRVHF